jgi:hypothetical protein
MYTAEQTVGFKVGCFARKDQKGRGYMGKKYRRKEIER